VEVLGVTHSLTLGLEGSGSHARFSNQ
jgi:hypothetical protein